jgi:hypothetical protein
VEPAAVWVVTHNLGFRPNVQAFDSAGGQALGGLITHVSTSQLSIDWSGAVFGGTAICS